MIDYTSSWAPYLMGNVNGKSYYKRLGFWFYREESNAGGFFRDTLYFYGLFPPFALA